MSRKAGTPNKPKGAPPETNPEDVRYIENAGFDTDKKYKMLIGCSKDDLSNQVNIFLDTGYECQGGASVTNYRALDGSIVMVYVQAMVRREG